MIPPAEVFDIQKTQIKALFSCSVSVDPKQYKKEDYIETSEKIIIPGILDFYIPEFDDHSQIVLNYNVDLLKTNNVEEEKNIQTITYDKGDVVIEKKYRSEGMNLGLLTQSIQGRIQYIKDPKILLNMLHDLLPNVNLVHIELILSNMFRIKDKQDVRCRLSGNYKNSTILGIAKQPHQDSWKSALAFQHIDKAIEKGLVEGKPTERNPIEKILNEEFDEL